MQFSPPFPCFDEGFSVLLDHSKFQWLQDTSEINGDNLNNVRCEARRHFKNKKREYPKDKINELAMNSKNKYIKDLYRGINEFKRGYQPRNNLVKDGDLLAGSQNILNRWKKYFPQLLNVHVSDVAIAKLKKYKFPDSHQIPAELIQAGGEIFTVCDPQNSLILF
jgi:hypothetical protein